MDSKHSPAVQVADVMIGAIIEATNTMAGQRSGGLIPEALTALYRDDQIISLGPSIDFEASKAFRRGSQSSAMIDYLAKHAAGVAILNCRRVRRELQIWPVQLYVPCVRSSWVAGCRPQAL